MDLEILKKSINGLKMIKSINELEANSIVTEKYIKESVDEPMPSVKPKEGEEKVMTEKTCECAEGETCEVCAPAETTPEPDEEQILLDMVDGDVNLEDEDLSDLEDVEPAPDAPVEPAADVPPVEPVASADTPAPADVSPVEPAEDEDEEDKEMVEMVKSLNKDKAKLLKENKNLSLALNKLSESIQDTALDAFKNRMINKLFGMPLNKEQKMMIAEYFDEANDMEQVKMIYEMVQKAVGVKTKFEKFGGTRIKTFNQIAKINEADEKKGKSELIEVFSKFTENKLY